MYGILIFFYVLVCIGLTVVILLQSSKGGGLAGAFGGGGGDMGAVFGGRGAATFLSRLTTGFAIVFLVFSLLLSFVSRGSSDNAGLVQKEQQKRAAGPASDLPFVPTGDSQPLLPIQTDQQTPAPVDSGQ